MITLRTIPQLKSFVKRTYFDSASVYTVAGRNRHRSLLIRLRTNEYDGNGCNCFEPEIINVHVKHVIYNPRRSGTSYSSIDEAKHAVDPKKYPLPELPF